MVLFCELKIKLEEILNTNKLSAHCKRDWDAVSWAFIQKGICIMKSLGLARGEIGNNSARNGFFIFI